MSNRQRIKDNLAALINEFASDESGAPFSFDIDATERRRDTLVIVRITEKGRTNSFWKTAFIIRNEAQLDIFRTYLHFLSSANLQQKF